MHSDNTLYLHIVRILTLFVFLRSAFLIFIQRRTEWHLAGKRYMKCLLKIIFEKKKY